MAADPIKLMQLEALHSQIQMDALEEHTRSEIVSLLHHLELEIVKEVLTADPTAVSKHAYQQARLLKLLAEVKRLSGSTYKKTRDTLDSGLEEAGAAAAASNAKSINAALGAAVATPALPPSLLRKLVDDTLVESAPSAEWWARQDKYLVQKFYDQMRLGLAKGDTLEQLIQRVRGVAAHNGKMAVSGIMDVSRRNAAALVRTATQSITNQARMQSMLGNRNVVKGVQWLATLDNRTTQICRQLDGKTWYREDDGSYTPNGHKMPFPGPTAHWGCRSVVIPWLKSWEEMAGEGADAALLKKLDAISPGTRSSLHGQVPGTLTYEEWAAAT